MRTVGITGAYGFIGRNLVAHLRSRDDLEVHAIGSRDSDEVIRHAVQRADVIVHLAGVNRPSDVEAFVSGNVGATEKLCSMVAESGRLPHFIFTSSIQAEQPTPYGLSKRRAEQVLENLHEMNGSAISIVRLRNVFGKWCRPHYNSVVATLCHAIAHDEEFELSDPNRVIELVHIDDVVAALIHEIDRGPAWRGCIRFGDDMPSYCLTLGDLAGRIQAFQSMQETFVSPDFQERFNQQLYGTFLSHIDPCRREYGLRVRQDSRGSLAEFMKSSSFGQIFVSHTVPGVTRGNHYHHTKTEKFLVVAGDGLIRLRHVGDTTVQEHRIRGEDYRVVEIPPGYTHSITNVGSGTMVTLFWASEVFDPDRPDTIFMPVEAVDGSDSEVKASITV